MNKKILIDFEKSQDPFSGLGQFSLFLKKYFDQYDKNINYFIPPKKNLAKIFSIFLPKCDVFHAIHQDSPYSPSNKKTKFILTIHDLNAIYENKSEKFKQKYLRKLQKNTYVYI